MNSETPSVEISQNFTSTALIPGTLNRWGLNTDSIAYRESQMYAVNFSIRTVGASPIPEAYEVAGITEDVHLKLSANSPQVLG